MTVKLRLSLGRLPELEWSGWYAGFWHPASAVDVAVDTERVALVRGTNCFVVSGRACPLWHRAAPDDPTVAFRGYVLEPPVGQFSASSEIVSYWRRTPFRQHNGVFSAALVHPNGESLQLITDAFGVGTLYLRRLAGGVAFATHARLLGRAGDPVDPLGLRSYAQVGYVCGDRTVNRHVTRAPAGSVLTCDEVGLREARWFDAGKLVQSELPPEEMPLGELHAGFVRAVDRCVRVGGDQLSLPLSGGDDSRRILGALIDSRKDFSAITMRIRHKGAFDVDGPSSSALAARYGFAHTLLEMPGAEQAAIDNLERLQTLAAETRDHAWLLPMMRLLRTLPHRTAVLDGLGGDVLGMTGFVVPAMHEAGRGACLALVQAHVCPDTHERIFANHRWPSLKELRADLAMCATNLPDGDNLADLLFLLLRSRRSTGLWSQLLLPGKCLPLYPYLDLDYVAMSFKVSPRAKIASSLQRRILEACAPELAAFAGTRNLGKVRGMPSDAAARNEAMLSAIMTQLSNAGTVRDLRMSLTLRARALSSVAARVGRVRDRVSWWLMPLAESFVPVFPPVMHEDAS